MWKHHLEALRKFTFSNYLIGAKKPDPSTGTLLNSTICHVSPSLQYMGHTITAKDVLLGEFPGIVLGAIETENFFFRATPNAGDGESWRVSFMVDHHKQRENCTSCFGRKKSYMVVSWNRAAFALLALKKVVTCFCTHKLYTLRHIVPQICVPVWNGIILNNISMDILCSCIFLNIYLAAQGAAITVCYLLLTWKTL